MPSDVKKLTQGIKSLKKILNDSAELLKDTADKMFKFSKSLAKIEKDIGKIKVSKVETVSISSLEQPSAELVVKDIDEGKHVTKIGPPKRIESPHAPPHVPPHAPPQELETIPVEPSKEIMPNLSQEKETLGTISDEISGLLIRLKDLKDEEDIYKITSEQREKAIKDMAEAIKILTDEYNKASKD